MTVPERKREPYSESGSVLFVDNDEGVRDTLRIFAEYCLNGVTSRFAAYGDDALALMAEQDPDVVVMAYHLQGMKAEDLYRNIRARSNARIVFLSGDYRVHRVARTLEADGCLDKPFHLEELDTLIRKMIQKPPKGCESGVC